MPRMGPVSEIISFSWQLQYICQDVAVASGDGHMK